MSHPVYYCEEHGVCIRGEALAWRHEGHGGYRRIGDCSYEIVFGGALYHYPPEIYSKIHAPTKEELKLMEKNS